MDVRLVARVPDEPVRRGTEHVVERHGEFDHTKARPEVAADLGDHVDVPVANLSDERLELVARQFPEISGDAYSLQQRHRAFLSDRK